MKVNFNWVIILYILLILSSTFNYKAFKKLREEPKTKIIAVKTLDPTVKVSAIIDLSHYSYETIRLKVGRITAYNNEVKQTSSTPNTMASNRPIYEGAVAISQDIINKYKLKFGDYVCIPNLKDECFIFEDKMAYGRKKDERVIKNTIDIFMYNREEAKTFRLLDQDVVIYRLPRNQ